MSQEKPWEKQFDNLLNKIAAKWKGEIKPPDPKTGKSMFVYPSFLGKLNGRIFEIEVSEFPDRRMNMLEAEDNVEYLRISVSVASLHTIRIVREDFAHKVRKALRLAKEFQTGNKRFDKRFWLKPGAKVDEILLTKPAFQENVFKLEPLSLLQITKSGILWSQEITKGSQLNMAAVEKYLNAVMGIAKIIEIKKPKVTRKPAPKKQPAVKKAKVTKKTATKKKVTTPKKTRTAKKAGPVKVRCQGKKADGTRCKRMVTKPAKYCYLHKKK